MPNTLIYNVLHKNELSIDLLTGYIGAYEEAKNASPADELKALMNILEHSFIVFEEHLVLEFFMQCEKLCIDLKAEKELSRLYFLLANTYFKQAEYTLAIQYFIISAKISHRSNYIDNTCTAYCYVSSCYTQNRDYEAALQYTHTANWLYKKHLLTNEVCAMKINHQYATICKFKNIPALDYYMGFLDDFLATSSNEKEKGKIYLLKSSLAAQQKDYNKEYENLCLSLDCYLQTSNLNKQMILLNLLLNCPVAHKTSTAQNKYLIQLNAIIKKIRFSYEDLSFKRLLHYFNVDHFNEIILPNSVSEKELSATIQELIPNEFHLLIVSLKESKNLTEKQLITQYTFIEQQLFSHFTKEQLVCSYLDNQLVLTIQHLTDENIRSSLHDFLRSLEPVVGEICFGIAKSNAETLSLKHIYNFAYADFYYNNSK